MPPAPSPKRKSDSQLVDTTSSPSQSKKPRLDDTSSPTTTTMPTETTNGTTTTPAPDSHINPAAAIAYWSSTAPTVDGVLGGYPQVSRTDLQGSSNFLAKLRRASKQHPPGPKLKRAADCGAGIGRITTGFLTNVAESVDVIEPVKEFTDVLESGKEGVGEIVNLGLEDWQPDSDAKYDLIWNQWCVGQLTDAALIAYLRRLPKALSLGGWIVVKENLSNHHLGEDVYDEIDSSVTRTDEKFRALFKDAGMKIVTTEIQKGMPKELYQVRSYALQPI